MRTVDTWYRKSQEQAWTRGNAWTLTIGQRERTGTYGKKIIEKTISAQSDGLTIGQLRYLLSPSQPIYVYTIDVAKSRQREGIATAMIERLCNEEGVEYSEIAWSNLYPDGKALKDALDKSL